MMRLRIVTSFIINGIFFANLITESHPESKSGYSENAEINFFRLGLKSGDVNKKLGLSAPDVQKIERTIVVPVNDRVITFTNLFIILKVLKYWFLRYLCLFCGNSGSDTPVNTTVTLATTPRYFVGTQKVNWMEAQLFCKQTGYELTTVESQQEMDLLLGFISTSGIPYGGIFWTSGNDIFREGSFTWLSTGKPITTFLPAGNAGGQPDNAGGEDCVVLWEGGAIGVAEYIMNDLDCEAEVYFICKQD